MSGIDQQQNQGSSQDVTENVHGVIPIQEQPTAEQVDSVEGQPMDQQENIENNPVDSEAPSEAKSDMPPVEDVQDPEIPQEEQVQEPPQIVKQTPPQPEQQVPQQPVQEPNPLPPANTLDTSLGSQGAGSHRLTVTPAQADNTAPQEAVPTMENQEDQIPAVIQEEEENNENSLEQLPMEQHQQHQNQQQDQLLENIPENSAEEQRQQEIDALNMEEHQNLEEDVDQDHHHEQMQQQLYEEQRLQGQNIDEQDEYERNKMEYDQNMEYDIYAQQSEDQPMYYIDDNIAKRVEQEKLDKIYYESHNLKQLLVIEEGRCEICTLMPPCKHHSSARVQEGHEDIQDQLQMYSNSEQQSQIKGATEVSMGGSTAHKTRDQMGPQRQVQSMEHMNHERAENLHMASEDSSPTRPMGRTHAALNTDRISPYSVLRNTDQVEVQSAIQKLKEQAVIAKHGGKRSTRTEILRQLALQQKIARNPFLQKEAKLSKQETDKLAMDPLINDQSFTASQGQFAPKARMRNKQGHYQSIDVTASRGQSLTAYGSSRISHFDFNETDINKAEHRLRVIERISKYREEKIKREFLKLEDELRVENNSNQKKMRKEQRMQDYHDKQRERLQEYQKYKALQHQADLDDKMKYEQHKSILNDLRIIRNEENKAKLKAYKQMKAQQILEIQRMEQEQRIMLVRSKAQMARNKFNYSFDLQYQQKRHKYQQQRSSRKGRNLGGSVDFRTIQPGDRYTMDEQNEELENGMENLSANNPNVGSPFGQKNSKQFRNNLTWGNKQTNFEVEQERDQQLNLKIQLNNASETGKSPPPGNNRNASISKKHGPGRSHNLSMGNYLSSGDHSPAKSSVRSSQIKLNQHNNIQMKQKRTKMEEREIRDTLNLKLQRSDNEESAKLMRYKGGKVLYKSIEKPLKLYTHGMRIVDSTNPNNQKVLKNRYVQNYDPKYQIGVIQNPEIFTETNQQTLKKQIFRARQQQKMVIEPYANIPYRKGESKSKLGVQYPKNLHIPIKALREMDDPNLGNSPIKQEMKNIREENHSEVVEDRKEEQVLENVANPQMFDNQAAVEGTSTSGQREQTATIENPVVEENQEVEEAPAQEQNIENQNVDVNIVA